VAGTSAPTSSRDLGLAVCEGGAGFLAGLGGGVEEIAFCSVPSVFVAASFAIEVVPYKVRDDER
jgi:hypothetical protein